MLTESRSLVYDNMDLALVLSEQWLVIFSLRSVVAIAAFALAAIVLGFTRIGRDIIAHRQRPPRRDHRRRQCERLIIGTFICSGALAAMSGALLSYSLASASPSGLSDVLVPAAAAAILGGVSLSGGTGTPHGHCGRSAHPCRHARRSQRDRRAALCA